MTVKKRTQKGVKDKRTRAQLKARATEIVADVNTFDADTRREVYVKLSWLTFAESGAEPQTPLTNPNRCERELRETIRKAEKGEPLINVGHLKPEAVAQARLVYALMENGINGVNVPDFIMLAAQTALDATAKAEGLELWLDVDDSGDLETGGYSVARMAVLFERRPGFGVEVEPKLDLAGLVSAVLKHPDTPRELYSAMRREIATMTEPDEVNESPDVLRVALAVHKAEQEEEGGES